MREQPDLRYNYLFCTVSHQTPTEAFLATETTVSRSRIFISISQINMYIRTFFVLLRRSDESRARINIFLFFNKLRQNLEAKHKTRNYFIASMITSFM